MSDMELNISTDIMSKKSDFVLHAAISVCMFHKTGSYLCDQ